MMKRSIAILLFGLMFATYAAAQDETKKDPAAGAAKPAEATPASLNPVSGGKEDLPAPAQDPAPALDTAKPVGPVQIVPATAPTTLRPTTMSAAEILKRNRTAMGLSLTEAKIASTVASGTIEISGLPGTVEIYSKAPDRQLMIVNLKGFGQVIESFDGTEAWSQDPLSGFRLKDGSELVQTKEASLFDRDAQLVKLYPKLVVRGIGKVNGRDAYVVEATSSTDRAETWHFDTESFLLVKQDTVVDTPQGKFPVETYLEDYRLVNGVRIAFSNRAVTSAQTVVMRFTEIKTNVAIDDARFAKPTAP